MVNMMKLPIVIIIAVFSHLALLFLVQLSLSMPNGQRLSGCDPAQDYEVIVKLNKTCPQLMPLTELNGLSYYLQKIDDRKLIQWQMSEKKSKGVEFTLKNQSIHQIIAHRFVPPNVHLIFKNDKEWNWATWNPLDIEPEVMEISNASVVAAKFNDDGVVVYEAHNDSLSQVSFSRKNGGILKDSMSLKNFPQTISGIHIENDGNITVTLKNGDEVPFNHKDPKSQYLNESSRNAGQSFPWNTAIICLTIVLIIISTLGFLLIIIFCKKDQSGVTSEQIKACINPVDDRMSFPQNHEAPGRQREPIIRSLPTSRTQQEEYIPLTTVVENQNIQPHEPTEGSHQSLGNIEP